MARMARVVVPFYNEPGNSLRISLYIPQANDNSLSKLIIWNSRLFPGGR